MRIAVFKNALDNVPKPVDVTWQELAQSLTEGQKPVEVVDKRYLPAWSPTEYREGDTRGNGALRLHAGVLDFDELTEQQLIGVYETLKDRSYAVHSSWSHGWRKTGYSFRLILNLTRPVEAYEHSNFWRSLSRLFAGLADDKCPDIGHCYFGPFYPPNQVIDPPPFAWIGAGDPLDVDALLTGNQRRALVADDLHSLAAKVRTRRPNLATALKALLVGEPYAAPGERDTTIFQVTRALIDEYPDLDPDSVVGWFARSTEAMLAVNSDTPSLDVVREKVDRLLQEDGTATAGSDRIGQALGNPSRKHPYSEAELTTIASQQGCSVGELRYRWVLQKGSSYYCLVGSEYRGPYTRDDFVAAAARDLAPASSAGVELVKTAKDGEQMAKSAQALVRAYGTVLDEVVIDMTSKVGKLDAEARTYYEPGSPLRPLEPAYDEQVAQWLAHLAGEHLPQVQQWLSALTWLEKPCVALFMTGPGGAGKSLFAEGAARLWTTTQSSTLEGALARFNDEFLLCPLTFADESLPQGFSGKNRTEEIRQWIQARSRTIQRKFLPPCKCIGAARVVIAANNDQILRLSSDLNEHDLKAITDRFLHVAVQQEAVDYLRSLPDGGESFVTQDRIAKHSLWLRDNLQWEPQGRFLIEGRSDGLYNRLVNTVGLRSAVLGWIVSWLTSNSRHLPGVFVRNGQVWITTKTVADNWKMYYDKTPPDVSLISRKLSDLSTGQARARIHHKTQRYWLIDNKHLRSWVRTNDAILPEELELALETDSG